MNKEYNLNNIISSNRDSFKLLLNTLAGDSRKRKRVATISGIGIILLIFFNTVLKLLLPYIAKIVLDTDIPNKDLIGLRNNSSLAIIIVAISALLQYVQTVFIGKIGQEILFRLRNKLFAKLQNIPISFFSENKSGDIINRITKDVEAINVFLTEGVQRFTNTVFRVITSGVLMFLINRELTVISILPLIIIGTLLYFQGKILGKFLKKTLDKDGDVSSYIKEIVNGFAVIKAYNMEKFSESTFEEKNKDYLDTAIKSAKISSLGSPVINLIIRLGTVAVIFFAMRMLSRNEITLGIILSFTVYILEFYSPLSNIGSLWKTIQNGFAATQRINGILKIKNNILLTAGSHKSDIKGNIEFRNVTFEYESGSPVLSNINFFINAKEKIAIVGPTGGGKTTFVNLIARLYDPIEGEILIDSINLKKWDLSSLRSQIGYLLQDTFLFEDSIINNLSYGNDNVTESKAEDILREIGAWDIIDSKPHKLHTIITRDNSEFSVGQKQLIAIARILLREPRVLILDEATASLDSKSEDVVQRAIDVAVSDVTSLIIAHRLSTIENADRIILINNNRIIENGTKNELLDKKGEFYNMYTAFKSK